MPAEWNAQRLLEEGLCSRMLEAAPDALIVIDPEGRIVLVNAQTEQVFGYRREELSYQPVEMLLPARSHAVYQQYRAAHCTEPGTQETGAVGELYCLHKEGFEFPVEISLGHIAIEEGLLAIVAVRDITNRRAEQAQMFEANKLESLGRLAGGIAHDFNNLLMAILGYAELAQEEIAAESEAAQFLTMIQSAAERAASLTRQLLSYARRRMVAFHSVNLNTVILDMEPLLQNTVGRQCELTLALADSIWNVTTDVSYMEQVLLNLIVNARDAMPAGGRIKVETANVVLNSAHTATLPGVIPGEYAMFSVSDNGPGMTQEIGEHIFEPFFTSGEVGQGPGMNLATCYGIVKQSGGTIEVSSELGKGTTFKVYLPRAQETSESPALAPTVEQIPTGTETILLVDDEPMVRDIAARTLRTQGYQVLEASDGVEALRLQAAWKGEIHLLLSDVVMPHMGGHELAALLREARPGVRVLHMSGFSTTLVLKQGVLEPGGALLTKPFTSVDLLHKVRAVLNS